ncbi:hypothetical protein [Nodularia chucula]|uniref:hypothetical protein n=1 Tax=Nodularia chucula TaxID=3093667 RepID=UPI0039C5E007
MRNLSQRLQDIGFRYGAGLEPHDINYSEPIADGWDIGLSTEYNLIAVLHYSGVLTINAEFVGEPEMFWDATKALITDELAQVSNQSKQLSLF